MESKSRKNRKTIILIISSILFLIIVIVTVFIIMEKDKLSSKYISLAEEYKQEDKLYTEKERELKETEEKINEIKEISKKTEEEKIIYFKNIKKLEDEILNGTSNQKIAYLTFDDGPYYNTYKFLEVLDKYDVKATFFTTNINGEYCYDNKNENCHLLYKEYLKRGHTIANHTYTHGLRSGLYASTKNFINAVKNQERLIENETGYITNIVRFPGGSSTAKNLKNEIIEELRNNNYGWVDWTAQDGDGGNLTSKEQAWSIFKSSIDENIEVVLLHDYSNITLSMLPDIITYLQDNGYTLLPLFYESNMINK